MISVHDFRKTAMSLPGSIELPHFEKSSFRLGKKIFATLTPEHSRACVKLSPEDQSVFCLIDKEMIYPVPNKWGLQGWTNINLSKVTKPILKDILSTAYSTLNAKSIK
jgi:predicted DNA-binding protein (MmcQ/YjbR family)